jgi:hypothetical protein
LPTATFNQLSKLKDEREKGGVRRIRLESHIKEVLR